MLSSGGMIASGLINCVMDPMLGFGIGPFPRMGMAGFALATTVGRGVATLAYIVYLFSKKTSYQFRPSYFWLKLKTVAEIYRIGIASILRSMAGSISLAVANVTAVSYGTIPLALRSVLFRASSLSHTPIFGLGQGILPLVGYNYGAKKNERVGEVVIKAGLAAFIWGSFCWVIAMLFTTPLISIFNTDPEFIRVGTQALRIWSWGFFISGTQMVLSFFFQGTGRGMASLLTAASRQVLFLIPGLFIFPRLFGLIGLWIAFPVADFLAFVLTLALAGMEFRRLGIPFRLRYPRVS